MPRIDSPLHTVLAVAIMGYVFFRLGREPFRILGRRLTGQLPLRPLGAEPGAERWYAIGGVLTFAGIGVAALVSRPVGYSIVACGLLFIAYAGAHVTLDRNGAARAFARRAWTEQGLRVPAPLIGMRIIGASMVLVGLLGAATVLDLAFA